MKEIRIHARAGQGAITTAFLLGYAYFLKGMYPYAFPHFGAARMGAPMNAFVRVDSRPVRLRSQIYKPDYVVVVDPTLMRGVNCFLGLAEAGIAIVNGKQGIEVPKVKATQKVFLVPANDIALKTIGRPLGNTALLGAFACATNEFDLDILLEAIKKRFSGKAREANLQAVKQGFEFIKDKIKR
ncbi:MAG: 2-oxoacid:acceptor oxidoreductase family protein [Candidatus Omnitrophica bacterium]|nr:2-oxoacid:acceptor oxidoreductase family protein [Candidatus Omnitrophota bacterium]MBU4345708.1 2-oxoacid:acceptor oxidoreductase family protein [Candidatus Omnitrophota bacterium]MBU4473163.1 2-oxoacid:acceptor oxidoreductase family protein [Candidatus Omnitrophota bacterium]MCG2706450.1 2-oxoacid:acceptor oxidoreductase family protein [Candidatus Omnitrophota bacterium]